jgi:oligopeptide transport system permease protein
MGTGIGAETGTAGGKWAPIDPRRRESEKIAGKSATYFQNAAYQFTRRKTATASLAAVALLVLAAVFGPMASKGSYDAQNLSHVSAPPMLRTYEVDGRHYYITANVKLAEVSQRGELMETLPRARDDSANKRFEYDVGGKSLYIDYSAPAPVLEDEAGNAVAAGRTFWNRLYPLGSDSLGRDIFTRLLYGARVSLAVAFIATLVNLVIGVLYGSVSGYAGGTLDIAMMRVVDIVSSIPLTLYVILIMVLFGNGGLSSIIIALGIVYWVSMARAVRGQILGLKGQDFVTAASTMGSSGWYILRKHLIPNAIGPITVTATMQIPSAIFTEAFMSFIGLGVTAPMASWGTMCNDALETLKTAPYQLAFPAAAICATMFAFNFIGDGLRDAFDPHMRK